MTEQSFWKRFLASEFFHRSRTGGRPQLTPYDDIFDRCLQEEDDGNKKNKKKKEETVISY